MNTKDYFVNIKRIQSSSLFIYIIMPVMLNRHSESTDVPGKHISLLAC